jgi:hypothetical protein
MSVVPFVGSSCGPETRFGAAPADEFVDDMRGEPPETRFRISHLIMRRKIFLISASRGRILMCSVG